MMGSKGLKNYFRWQAGFNTDTFSLLCHNSLGPKYTNYGSEGPIKTLLTTLAFLTTVSEDLHNLLGWEEHKTLGTTLNILIK